MRTVIAFTLLALLVPSIASACPDRKPVRCSSYTSINGTTHSTCR
jgi:hypothetical protein